MTIQELKEKQLETILTFNPMLDDYHTGIRTISDIHTFQELYGEEILNGSTYDEPKSLYVPDIEEILKKGNITVYSSYPIKQGVFVTPSKVEARSYSGGKVNPFSPNQTHSMPLGQTSMKVGYEKVK